MGRNEFDFGGIPNVDRNFEQCVLEVSHMGKGKNEIKACKRLFNDATVANINRKKPLQSGPLSFIESFSPRF